MTAQHARYRARLAYDGTAYFGFQRQAGDTPTVQDAVERAIAQTTGQPVTIMSAGRTDTGVHASGQVIAFDVAWAHDDHALLRAINIRLPDDIALQDIRQQPGFHPRYDALSRCYEYTILRADQRHPLMNRHTWQIHWRIDLEIMQQAAKILIGTHDFASFGKPPQGENTVRHVMQSEWRLQPHTHGDLFVYQIRATAFLYHMVRHIVGTLVKVGRGKLSLTEFEAIFRAADLSLTKAMAPPQGLVLTDVAYPD